MESQSLQSQPGATPVYVDGGVADIQESNKHHAGASKEFHLFILKVLGPTKACIPMFFVCEATSDLPINQPVGFTLAVDPAAFAEVDGPFTPRKWMPRAKLAGEIVGSLLVGSLTRPNLRHLLAFFTSRSTLRGVLQVLGTFGERILHDEWPQRFLQYVVQQFVRSGVLRVPPVLNSLVMLDYALDGFSEVVRGGLRKRLPVSGKPHASAEDSDRPAVV